MNDELAQELMDDFARNTGLTGECPPRRYLWTDAFAVCNFVGLSRRTGEARYRELSLKLVDQVHQVLGRHRPDDSRAGWISGLADAAGELHPTSGGLRIGKPLNERDPGEPSDPRLEWDQDGQYFHYLTKWMHALTVVYQETGDLRYLRWAAELAAVTCCSFTYEIRPGGPKRMAWKMSIDLSRPLVGSMGQHDPLDGLITCLELQSTAGFAEIGKIDLKPMIADMSAICATGEWATDDPLGIGGLLDDATRLAQMSFQQGVDRRELLLRILIAVVQSLRNYDISTLRRSAEHRPAFRELGLAIGLSGLNGIRANAAGDREITAITDLLMAARPLAERIKSFWSNSRHRQNEFWQNHRDINTVMLATSLAPDGYLEQSAEREVTGF